MTNVNHSIATDTVTTELGALPDGWTIKQLVDIATLQRGKDLTRQNQVHGDFPVVGSSGVIGYHNQYNCSDAGLVVGRSGSIGKLTFIESSFWAHNTVLYVKDFHGNCPKFIYYMLQRVDFKKYASGVSVPTLNRNLVHPILLPLPSVPEQKRIADVLSTVQEAKEKTENVIRAAKELKKSLMKYLFTYGAVPVEEAENVTLRDTDFGSVPSHWEIIPLDRCSIVQTGLAKGRRLTGEDIIAVPYLRVANVQDGYLNLSEIKYIDIRKSELDRFLLREGDIVLTEGGDFDKLGRGFIWKSEIPSCVHQNHIFAVRANSKIVSPEFLAYMVQSGYAKAYFLSVAHKTTNLACINTMKLKALPVPIPPREEQGKITSILDRIDQRIKVEEDKRKGNTELFNTMLHNIMTGKVRVNDLEV